MKHYLSISIIALAFSTAPAVAFWDSVKDQVTDSDNISAAVSKLDNVDIGDPSDQKLWDNFVQKCIVDHISTEKLMTLANSSTEHLLNFLQTYQAPEDVKVNVGDHYETCVDALPTVTDLVSASMS